MARTSSLVLAYCVGLAAGFVPGFRPMVTPRAAPVQATHGRREVMEQVAAVVVRRVDPFGLLEEDGPRGILEVRRGDHWEH